MPSDADIRAVLREHGIEVTQRGRLSDEAKAQYERITGRAADTDDGDLADDDDAGTPITDPPEGDYIGGSSSAPHQEKRPNVGAGRRAGGGLGGRWRNRNAGSGKKGKTQRGKPRPKPRVSTDRVISRLWDTGARLLAPVSTPVARTLELQAGMAGIVIDDALRGTIVDKGLQPWARAEERGKKVWALAGPPLLVYMIERAQGLEEPYRQQRLAFLQNALKEALTSWVELAGDETSEAAERLKVREETKAEVQKLLDSIFAMGDVVPEAKDGAASAEDEQVRTAQQTVGV